MSIDISQINKALGNIDLYLLDQVLKGRYPAPLKILDVGCGEGRNLVYFLNQGYEVYGVDSNPSAIRMLQFVAQTLNPALSKSNFSVASIEELSFDDQSFDLVICSAVLHFAKNSIHFDKMMAQLCRILKPQGHLFIRTATSWGIEKDIIPTGNDCYDLPDGSNRFLISKEDIENLPKKYNLEYIEPPKVVNVAGQRCMSTLVFSKK